MDDTGGYAAQFKDTGDEAAFGRVLSECEPLIARYSYWLGTDRQDAAQELRMAVVEAIRDWDGVRPFMGFAATVLYRVASTLLARRRRANRIRTFSLDGTVDEEDGDEISWHETVADPNAAMPDEKAERDDDVRRAREILASHDVPRSKMNSFVLTVIKGQTYRAAAKIKKCNVKKVDNEIQEVRRKLRGTEHE